MFKKKDTNRRRRSGEREAVDTQTKRPSVFSYRASRSNVSDNLGRGQTKEEAVRRPGPSVKSRIRRAVKILLVVGLAVFVLNNLLLNSDPKIVMVDATNIYRNPAAYQTAAADAFAASKLNSNKITVNTKSIRDSLLKAFPELADVSVSLPLVGRQPTVYLEPSTSRLIVHTSNGTFVLDDTGRAVASGAIVESLKEAGLPEIHDESQLDVTLGSVVLPSTSVAFITEVAQQLKVKNMAITNLKLTNTPSELHLNIQDVGYYIKFNTRGNARVAVGAFTALKQYLESQRKTPAEYIDVRVESRAYYK